MWKQRKRNTNTKNSNNTLFSYCAAVHGQHPRQLRRVLPAHATLLELALAGHHRGPQAILRQPDTRRRQIGRNQRLPGVANDRVIMGKRRVRCAVRLEALQVASVRPAQVLEWFV
jgi:hypothetical protein